MQGGQQFPGGQHPGQPMGGHPMPGGGQFPGHQMPGQQMPGQQMPGQQMPGQQVPGQQPMPHQQFGASGARVKKNPIVGPIIGALLGVVGLILMLILIFLTDSPTYSKLVAFVVTGIVAAIGLIFYRWLDRWEPEPPFLLIIAFLWGAGVATFFGSLVNDFNAALFGDGFAAVVSAPFGEEFFKSLFLVLVLFTSTRGRRELNSLTDTLIYAGIVGLGFTFLEDIIYIIRVGQTPEELAFIVFVRIGLGAFGHSLYQSIFAVGLWAGIRRGGASAWIFGILGYLGAVALHMIHNGVSQFGIGALVIVLLLEFVIFVVGIVIAIRSSIGERKNLEMQLPSMVHFGWVTPREAGWLANMQARKQILKQAGPHEQVLKDFIQNATELAHLRTRLDQMKIPPSQGLLENHADLAALLHEQRSVVDQVLGQAQPHAVPGGWPPIQGHPGPQYPAPQIPQY